MKEVVGEPLHADQQAREKLQQIVQSESDYNDSLEEFDRQFASSDSESESESVSGSDEDDDDDDEKDSVHQTDRNSCEEEKYNLREEHSARGLNSQEDQSDRDL